MGFSSNSSQLFFSIVIDFIVGACLIFTAGGIIWLGQAQSTKTAVQEYDSVNEKT